LDNDLAAIVLYYLSVMTMGWKVAWRRGAWRRKHTKLELWGGMFLCSRVSMCIPREKREKTTESKSNDVFAARKTIISPRFYQSHHLLT
jgi:hypothetical protein